MKLLIACALALLPALLNIWWGRGLLRDPEAADLPERLWRHRRRVMTATLWTMIAAGWIGGWLPILLLVVTVMAAGFPARRALYEESWSFPAYLLFYVRLFLAFSGFWVALGCTPLLVSLVAVRWMWPVAVACGVVLLLWSRYFSSFFPRILGAERLEGEDLAPFEAEFAPVLERTTAPEPRLWWVRLHGGRFPNAVALPSRRRQPGVLFWETLLEQFTPREVAAVFAHEVAHLEQFHERLLRQVATLELALITVAVSCVPLIVPQVPALRWWLPLLWSLVVILGLLLRLRISRRYETGADERALELCQDAEALISALEKLHVLSRMPRRLALQEEARISHPTLARRVAAIRRAAGGEAEAPGDGFPYLLAAGEGQWVVFEGNRVSWMSGVPEETEATPEALREAASQASMLRYDQITELRLHLARRGRHALRAADGRGASWDVPVPPEELPSLQRVLDVVDPYLATPRETRQTFRQGFLELAVRLAALAAGIGAALPPSMPALLLPGLYAALRPKIATLAALVLAIGATLLLRLGRIEMAEDSALLVNGTLALAALLAVLFARDLWRRGPPEERPRDALLAASLFGASALGVLLLAALWLTLEEGFTTFGVHRTALFLPGLPVLALASGAAWFFVRRWRWIRILTVPFLTLGALTLFAATPLFERWFVQDPMGITAPRLTPTREEWRETGAVELGVQGPSRLRLSPSGNHFAYLEGYDDGEWQEDRQMGWRLATFQEGPGVLIPALQVQFVTEDQLLVLREDPPTEEREGALELLYLPLEAPETPLWKVSLSYLPGATLRVEPRGWIVEGAPSVETPRGKFLRYQGSLDGAVERVSHWWEPESAGLGEWTPGVGEWALVSQADFSAIDFSSLADYADYPTKLWRVAATADTPPGTSEAELLWTTRLDPLCWAISPATRQGEDAVLCQGEGDDIAPLWHIPLRSGAPPEPLARLPLGGYGEIEASASGVLITGTNDRLWWLAPDLSSLREIRLPDSPDIYDAAPTATGEVVVLVWEEEGYRALRFAPAS